MAAREVVRAIVPKPEEDLGGGGGGGSAAAGGVGATAGFAEGGTEEVVVVVEVVALVRRVARWGESRDRIAGWARRRATKGVDRPRARGRAMAMVG